MSVLKVSPVRIDRRIETLLAGQAEPPVDLDRVAALLDVQIRRSEMSADVLGVLHQAADLRVVLVNAALSARRRRYVVAHELAHLAIHRVRETRVDSDFSIDLRNPGVGTVETIEALEASRFALGLLMPTVWLDRDLPSGRIDIGDDRLVGDLARRYGVAPALMAYRLATLHLDG